MKYAGHAISVLTSIVAVLLYFLLYPSQSPFPNTACATCTAIPATRPVKDYSNMSKPEAYTLPKLPYAYDALEPHISKQIMELHHSKHHQTYINNLNVALSSLHAAVTSSDVPSQISLQPAIKFNGGGHINHSLFWQNLSPASSPEAKTSAAPKLIEKIKVTWGDEETFKSKFSTALLGIQGSGWGWLVYVNDGTDRLTIVTTKDQDPIVGQFEVPIFGVDMWEHAYYLQYLNGKAAYVQNIWNVINWKVAEERFTGPREDVFKVLKASI